MTMHDHILDDIGSFEHKLGLPKGFYQKLLNEDDWSFVIKLSALFEAAATHALTARLGYPQLEGALSCLDHAHTKYGKVKLLKELGVISVEQANCLAKLAELRNRFAHDVSNVSMTFEQYISPMDANQKSQLIKWAGHGIHQEQFVLNGNTVIKRDFVLSNAKLSIWGTAQEILACMYLDVDASEHRNQLAIYQSLNNTSI
jgi:hypothetical protein